MTILAEARIQQYLFRLPRLPILSTDVFADLTLSLSLEGEGTLKGEVRSVKMTDNFKPADLSRRDTDRMRRYKGMLDIYQGVQWQGRERPGEKRLTFNYARVVIDKLTSYLMTGVKFVVGPSVDSDEGRQKARRNESTARL
jgi:hypothetical protein